MGLKEVSVFNTSFERVALLDRLISYEVEEQLRTTGKFTIWTQTTAESMLHLVKDNIVQFTFDNPDETGVRNLVLNSDVAYSATGTDAFVQSLNYTAYPVSLDADAVLHEQTIAFGIRYVASGVTIATGGYVRANIYYTLDDDPKVLTIELTDAVLVDGTDILYASVTLASGVLVFTNVEVLINQIKGTVTIDHPVLQVGSFVTSHLPAPEDSMELKYPNKVWGIIVARVVRKTDGFDGLEVHGNLLDDVLRWRCLWARYVNTDTIPNIVEDLITTNFISPTIADRTVSWVTLDNVLDTTWDVTTVSRIAGGYISEYIYILLSTVGLGLKAVYDKRSQQVRFYMYRGKDRSMNQSVLPYVMFSDNNGMLIEPEYTEDDSSYKNVARVTGTFNEIVTGIVIGTATGSARREIYVGATGVESPHPDNTPMTEAEFLQALNQVGVERLIASQTVKSLTSKVYAGSYIYGKDYMLGDTVSIIYANIGVAYHAPIESVIRTGAGVEESIELSFGKGILTLNDKIKSRLTY